MSMRLALKPYVTTGVALVGASVIAVTPIAAHPEAYSHAVQSPAVQLTAAIDNPFEVFAPVVDAAGNWIASTIQTELANPLPILHQIVTNQITTAAGVLEAVQAGAKGVGELVGGLPAALGAAGQKLAVGDVNGAIDAILAAGLNPIVSLISGVWTPLQPVLERPFQVGQALVPALFDAALSVTLGVVLSTVGIGFDTGTTPFVQQIVKSTQAVLAAVTTLNPINVLNAIQHGIADVAQNFVTQLDAFTTGTLPFVRDAIVRALQAPTPAPLGITASESAPEAVTGSETGTGTTDETTDATTAVKDTEDKTVVVKDTETVAVQTPVTEVTPVKEVTPVTEVKVDEEATEVTAVKDVTATDKTATGSTTVTRDSLKAEPGKTGLSTGTTGGSTTPTESTGNATVSAPAETSSTTDGTATAKDPGSGSESGGDSKDGGSKDGGSTGGDD